VITYQSIQTLFRGGTSAMKLVISYYSSRRGSLILRFKIVIICKVSHLKKEYRLKQQQTFNKFSVNLNSSLGLFKGGTCALGWAVKTFLFFPLVIAVKSCLCIFGSLL